MTQCELSELSELSGERKLNLHSQASPVPSLMTRQFENSCCFKNVDPGGGKRDPLVNVSDGVTMCFSCG